MKKPLNIIYLNPDEMRADVSACYGHPLVKTPNIDRLAAEGVRFDQCHVQHTVCTPSRCSFMTGWYPHTRGHRTLWNCLRPDEPNTLRYLKQAGYDVHWFGKNDLLAPECFKDSVSQIHPVTAGSWNNEALFKKGEIGHMSFLTGPIENHHNDYFQYERAVDVIHSYQASDKPFMLYLPTLLPHCSYHAPQPYHDMYDPNDIPPLRPAVLEGKPNFHELIRRYRQLDKLDDAVLKKIMAVYLGMVSYVDSLVGKILTALDETGQAENTAVFFFSDHGDWAGDYGLVEKWPSGLDDCLTRVPMIVRMPGNRAGHVVHEPVECFDIVPTTLQIAGIEAQHTHFARSMMPQLQGEKGDPNRVVGADGGYGEHEQHCFEGKSDDGVCAHPDGFYYPKGLQQQQEPGSVCRASMIRTAEFKLTRRPGDVHELYDLKKDPDELNNVHDDKAYEGILKDMQSKMLDWYIKTSDVTPFDTHPRGVSSDISSSLDLAGREYPVQHPAPE